MKTTTQMAFAGLFVVLFSTAVSEAQQGSKPEDATRRYNKSIEPIYDEIDSLRKKLDNKSLSMPEAAKLINQQGALRRKADALWSSTQTNIDNSYRQMGKDIAQYNAANRQLEYDSVVMGSMGDVMNNVAKYPTKDAFEANKAQMITNWDKKYKSRLKPFGDKFAKQKEDFFKRYKKKYGIDLDATGYSRIGAINPYTGKVYYKYYGPDGKVIAAQWKNDAAGYQKAQQDFATGRRRQRDQQTALNADAESLKQFKNEFQKSKSTGKQGFAGLEGSARRLAKRNEAKLPTNISTPPPNKSDSVVGSYSNGSIAVGWAN